MSVLFGGLERRHATMGAFQQSSLIPTNGQAAAPAGGNGSAEWSLQKVAVLACVTLVATIAECLPLEMFDSEGPNKQRMKLPAWLADLGGDGHGTADWCYQAVWSQMLRGNLYGLVPDGMADARMGTPTMIQLQHPDNVGVFQPWNGGPPEWRVRGQEVPAGEMWHRRVFPVPGRLLGASPIEQATNTISLAVASTKFGLMWFHEGAHPSGILTTETKLDFKAARTAKERFMAAIRGSREPVVLGGGWKFERIQVAPGESQFLETQGYTSAECCRIFGPGFAQIFGYETGESLTYANIEQRSLDLLMYSVNPWLVRLERMLSKLIPAERHLQFNRDALLKSDLLTRYRAHEIALRSQFATVNEVRAVEDQPPVAWGNEQPQAGLSAAPVPVSVED